MELTYSCPNHLLQQAEACLDPQERAQRRREKLATDNMKLVYRVATRIARRIPNHFPFDDLVGAGMVGLMDAAHKYDPHHGIRFESYAEFRVKGAILDQLRVVDPAPREMRKKIKQFKEIVREQEVLSGGPPEEEVIRARMQITAAELNEIKSVMERTHTVRLDDLTEFSGGDVLPDTATPGPYEVKDYKELLTQLQESIKALPERNQILLSLYYKEELNMKEIGQVLGITESRVSQLRSESLRRLKQIMTEKRDG